ncbi:MAG: hypothetical protein J4F28_09185 [Nitrosopumilaceae archaeon]|nr:hypothetical protein [Nitrosopumilaceae archaeon]
MPRWAKDKNEFSVRLNHDERRGCIAIIPKPVVEMLGKPDSITFVVDARGRIRVAAGGK